MLQRGTGSKVENRKWQEAEQEVAFQSRNWKCENSRAASNGGRGTAFTQGNQKLEWAGLKAGTGLQAAGQEVICENWM